MIEFEQIGLIVLGLIVIVQQFYIHKSVPLDKVAELIGQLRPIVLSTPSKLDDFALDTAQDILERAKSGEVVDPAILRKQA